MLTAARRFWVAIVVLTAITQFCLAAPADRRAFDNAVKFLDDGFYARAEEEFGKFVREFPGSPLLSEAILCQAQARFKQANATGAIQLLQTGQGMTNAPADQYLFWFGEAYFLQKDYRKASDSFAKLLKDHPGSSRALEASIKEAGARALLREWPRVIELLQQTNGVFQTMGRTNPSAPGALEGYLLLSEAQLAQANYPAADQALQPLGKLLLKPDIAWGRQHLICRIRVAEGKLPEALQASAELMVLATNAARRDLMADSAAFKAGVLERLSRPEEAIAAYQDNLSEGVPVERQRQALLKITELYLAQNKVAEAAQMLERFTAQYPGAESADLALLTLAELRLRQHVSGSATNRVEVGTNGVAANYLDQAFGSLNLLISRFTNSPLLGKAEFDLGWCYWFTNKMPESARAFRSALDRLPVSLDSARAHFKLGDTCFRQRDFIGALTNYNAVLEQGAAMPEPARREIETNLFEAALYQTVRTALAAGTPSAATNALQRLLTWYPRGFHTDRAVLIAGQEVSRGGNPAEARQMFSQFITNAPESALVPELNLAIAWTYEQENNWNLAITQYENWLTRFGNDPARPRAEYYRAMAYYQAGHETNSFTCFTNFIAQFPAHELRPRAQWWVAGYYADAGRLLEAESSYQLVWPKNLPPSELGYQAQLAAGKIAVARQAWLQASNYFITALYNDTNCPTDIRVEALFAYGDVLSLADSAETNKLGNFEEAIRVFGRICDEYPTHRCAALAWGRKAGCLLQWAQYSHQYEAASNAFQRVIDAPLADARARSNARIGLAIILEKQAQQQKAQADQAPLLQAALRQCLDVVYEIDLRAGEKPDPFWQKEGGLMAGRLLETLQEWSQAANLYRRLQVLLPPLRERLEEKIIKAQENLGRTHEKPAARPG
jgi:TolA-binding protein